MIENYLLHKIKINLIIKIHYCQWWYAMPHLLIRIFLIKWSIYCMDLIIVIFIIEILVFYWLFNLSWFHIIILLIVLELFILKIYFFSVYFSIKNRILRLFIFLFITVRVAEARLGISLLTILVRICGEDSILINNI